MAGQGLVGLGGAAGASEGFETLMTRRLLEQKQAETERAARAEEGIRQHALEQSGADQDLQRQFQLLGIKDLMETRKATAEDRDLSRADLKSRSEADRASREETAKAGRENQLSIAQLAAAVRESTARPPRFQFLQTDTGYSLGDPYTGQVMPSHTVGGTNPGGPALPSSAPERLVQMTRDQIKPTVDRLRQLSGQIHTNNDFGPRMKSATERAFGAMTGTDPVAREYQQLRKPVSLSLAAIANQGRPTEPDRIAVEALLPGFNERADVAKSLWDAVDRILTNPSKYQNIGLIQTELQAAKVQGASPGPTPSIGTGTGTGTTRTQNWGRDAAGRPIRIGP